VSIRSRAHELTDGEGRTMTSFSSRSSADILLTVPCALCGSEVSCAREGSCVCDASVLSGRT